MKNEQFRAIERTIERIFMECTLHLTNRPAAEDLIPVKELMQRHGEQLRELSRGPKAGKLRSLLKQEFVRAEDVLPKLALSRGGDWEDLSGSGTWSRLLLRTGGFKALTAFGEHLMVHPPGRVPLIHAPFKPEESFRQWLKTPGPIDTLLRHPDLLESVTYCIRYKDAEMACTDSLRNFAAVCVLNDGFYLKMGSVAQAFLEQLGPVPWHTLSMFGPMDYHGLFRQLPTQLLPVEFLTQACRQHFSLHEVGLYFAERKPEE